MRTLTITLATTQGVPMPDDVGTLSDFAGFKITFTAPSGNTGGPPVENKLVWTFGSMVEGATYKLNISAVDSEGRVIQSLPEASITVPAQRTYSRLDGYSLAWS
jgi:hypothetical protein